MALLFKIVKFAMRLLGFVERVQSHTRMDGLVKVAAYWRRA
jgi:hypothetical protein